MNDVPNRSDQDGPRKLATSGRLPRVELVWIGCAGLLNRDFYSTFADRAAAEDVVMVDVGPRILSAIEVRNHWRSDPAIQDTRTLMLSALGEGSVQVAPFAMGADDVIDPIESYMVLLQSLKALLRGREAAFNDVDQTVHHGGSQTLRCDRWAAKLTNS